MEFTASQIAGFIDGKIIGDENATISGVSPIESGEEGHLSFIAQDRFADYIDTTKCSVLIVSEKLLTKDTYPITIIAVEDAYLSFQILMNHSFLKILLLIEFLYFSASFNTTFLILSF